MRSLDSVRPTFESNPPIPFTVAKSTPFSIIEGHGPIASERFPDSPQAVFTVVLQEATFDENGMAFGEGDKLTLWLNYKAHTWLLEALESGEPVGPCVLTIIPTKRGSFKTVDAWMGPPARPSKAR